MSLSDTTYQRPATDDIDQDSLEYLFGRKKPTTPWVKIAREPEPIARISPEMVRLQAKLETFAMQMETMMYQLNKAHVDLGMAKAQLADKNEQLVLFAEYRAKAAYVVIADAERTVLKERIADLEMQLAEALEDRSQAEVRVSIPAPPEVYVRPPLPGPPPLPAPPALLVSTPCLIAASEHLQLQKPVVQPKPILPETPIVSLPPRVREDKVEVAEAILRHAQQESFSLQITMLPIIYALMICFASLVLLSILI